MLGFILLSLISVANSQEDDTTLRQSRDRLSSQLLSLQGNVQQKELYILKQEEVISDLQRQLRGVKAVNSEIQLKKKEQELLDLRGKIQSLQLVIDRQGSEFQQLEIISTSQRQRLDEVQQALDLIEELIIQPQAQFDENDQNIGKAHTHWLPEWAKNWQGTWIATINEVWKRAVRLAVCGYQRLLESKFLKYVDVLEVHVLDYMQKVQEVLEEQVHAVGEICMSFLGELVKSLGARLNESNSLLQPCLFKLRQYFNKALKYGIKRHLELQRKVRKILQSNGYLASKESKEVVWLLASLLLILPLYGALQLFSFLGKHGSDSHHSPSANLLRYAHIVAPLVNR